MKRFIIMILICLLMPVAGKGQSTFSANRPGQIDNPDITPPGTIMIESGFQYGRTNGVASYLLPTLSLRFGINSRLELSLNGDNVYQDETSVMGLTSNSIGSKLLICDEKGALPKMSLVTGYILPFAGIRSMKPEHSGGIIEIAASHTIGQKAVVYANAGATWSGNTSYPVYNWVGTLYFSPLNRFWIFAELYGFVPGEGASSYATDFGITWQLSDNIQVDLTSGFDLRNPSENHFIQAGAAFRIARK